MPPSNSLASILPPEILSHILRCAQEAKSIPQQYDTRLRFERVCKAWYKCDFKWRIVAVDGLDNITKLVAMLNESALSTALENLRLVAAGEDAIEDVASRIQTLHVTVPGRVDIDIAIGGSSIVASLLSKAVNVESLVLVQDELVPLDGRSDCLRNDVLLALGKLTQIKTFEMAVLGPDVTHIGFSLPAIDLFEFAPNWSKLETLTFTQCTLVSYELGLELITTTSFRELVLNHCDVCEYEYDSHSLMAVLPPHTRKLTINSRMWREHGSLLTPSSGAGGEKALDSARQIEELTVVDDPDCPRRDRIHPSAEERGHYDHFIRDFPNLTKLTVTPLALGDISSLTTRHPKLEELTLVLGYAVPQPARGSEELVRLLLDSRSLKRIELDQDLTRAWAAWEVGLLEDAAEGRVELSWF